MRVMTMTTTIETDERELVHRLSRYVAQRERLEEDGRGTRAVERLARQCGFPSAKDADVVASRFMRRSL